MIELIFPNDALILRSHELTLERFDVMPSNSRLDDALKSQLLSSGHKSSSSCRTTNTDLPNSLSQTGSIVHCSRKVFQGTFCSSTVLLYIGSSWSSCLCSSIWRGSQEYVTFEFISTSPAVFHMSGSSNWLIDGRTAAALWSVGSRTCSILLAAFLHNFRWAYFLYV